MTQDALGSLPASAARRADADTARLIDYAHLESPTGQREALDRFAERLEADAGTLPGATVRRVGCAAGRILVIEVAATPGREEGTDEAPLVALGHYDTVHPLGSIAGPVPLRREGDVLRGPGVYDMKSGLVAILGAIELLHACALDHRPLRLIITPDEEVGSPAAGPTVLDLSRGARAAIGLESPHPDGALKTARMGSTRWRVSVTGRASHAALAPEQGVHAIDELVDQLMRVRALAEEHPDVLTNVGAIAGGGRTNVIPESAHADVGLRFRDQAEEDAMLGALAALSPIRPGAHVDSTAITQRPAWPHADRELMSAVSAAGDAIGQSITGRPATGAADTNITGAAGIPSLDGFGLLGAGAHAADERVNLSSLPAREALLAAVIAAL